MASSSAPRSAYAAPRNDDDVEKGAMMNEFAVRDLMCLGSRACVPTYEDTRTHAMHACCTEAGSANGAVHGRACTERAPILPQDAIVRRGFVRKVFGESSYELAGGW